MQTTGGVEDQLCSAMLYRYFSNSSDFSQFSSSVNAALHRHSISPSMLYAFLMLCVNLFLSKSSGTLGQTWRAESVALVMAIHASHPFPMTLSHRYSVHSTTQDLT